MRIPSSSKQAGGGVGGKVTPCCSKMGLKRGPWTADEDELLANYIKKEGEGRWRTLPKKAGLLRCGKSCRLRWMNYLRPSVKRGHITPEEEDLILRLHRLLGNRWSLIAGRIPGRTDNEIKNYWNTHLSKKLISQGIDPRTHKPLLINPNPNSSTTDNNTNKLLASSSSYSEPNNIPNPIYIPFQLEEPFTRSNNINISTTDLDLDLDRYDQSDGMMLGFNVDLNNNIVVNYEENDDDDEMTRCNNDDVFSSFLNSLINEDMFNNQNQQSNNVVFQDFDPLVTTSIVQDGLMDASSAMASSNQSNPKESG